MTHKERTPQGVVIAAILSITALMLFALMRGMDGLLLTGTVGIIAGLAGWSAPQLKTK